MIDIGPILNFIKDVIAKPTLYFVVMLVSAILLFLPERCLKLIKLDTFHARYSSWIGFIFVLSAVIALVNTVSWIKHKIERRIKTKKAIKNLHARLWELFPAEKAIIIEMYLSPDRSIRLPHDNSSVAILLNYKMIQYGSKILDLSQDNPFFLQPWVCNYLDRHPEYLKEPFVGRDIFQN